MGLFLLKGLVLLPLVWILGGVAPGRFIRATAGTYTVGFTTTTSVGNATDDAAGGREDGPFEEQFLAGPFRWQRPINRPGSALFSEHVAGLSRRHVTGYRSTRGLIAAAVLAIFLASMTVAPVPSSSIVSMAPALDVVGVPLAGLGILLGIDRVPDAFRTAVNVIGHMSAATTVDGVTRTSRREGNRVSAGKSPPNLHFSPPDGRSTRYDRQGLRCACLPCSNVLFKYACARQAARASSLTAPLTHFVSPRGEKSRLSDLPEP